MSDQPSGKPRQNLLVAAPMQSSVPTPLPAISKLTTMTGVSGSHVCRADLATRITTAMGHEYFGINGLSMG